MIYEIRTYNLKVGQLAEYWKRFGEKLARTTDVFKTSVDIGIPKQVASTRWSRYGPTTASNTGRASAVKPKRAQTQNGRPIQASSSTQWYPKSTCLLPL